MSTILKCAFLDLQILHGDMQKKKIKFVKIELKRNNASASPFLFPFLREYRDEGIKLKLTESGIVIKGSVIKGSLRPLVSFEQRYRNWHKTLVFFL